MRSERSWWLIVAISEIRTVMETDCYDDGDKIVPISEITTIMETNCRDQCDQETNLRDQWQQIDKWKLIVATNVTIEIYRCDQCDHRRWLPRLERSWRLIATITLSMKTADLPFSVHSLVKHLFHFWFKIKICKPWKN